jgi:acyl homoserine lactone synthase
MHYVSGDSRSLHPTQFAGQARYRRKVFVDRLGWQLQCRDDMEFDQFDCDDTLYVVLYAEGGDVAGTARLLPTTGPYLLADVFSELFHGEELPCSRDVWELSRFAAMDFSLEKALSTPLSQFSSPAAVGLLHQALACAAERGAKRLITVSPLGVERLLRKAGFRAYRAGPPVLIKGRETFACWIDI